MGSQDLSNIPMYPMVTTLLAQHVWCFFNGRQPVITLNWPRRKIEINEPNIRMFRQGGVPPTFILKIEPFQYCNPWFCGFSGTNVSPLTPPSLDLFSSSSCWFSKLIVFQSGEAMQWLDEAGFGALVYVKMGYASGDIPISMALWY